MYVTRNASSTDPVRPFAGLTKRLLRSHYCQQARSSIARGKTGPVTRCLQRETRRGDLRRGSFRGHFLCERSKNGQPHNQRARKRAPAKRRTAVVLTASLQENQETRTVAHLLRPGCTFGDFSTHKPSLPRQLPRNKMQAVASAPSEKWNRETGWGSTSFDS